MVNFGNDWDDILQGEFDKEYYLSLRRFLTEEYKNQMVYPPMFDIFNAFKLTEFSDIKVVILGQDPYINNGEAHGLAFSVNKGIKIPPSLKNIFIELKNDLGINSPPHGCLTHWAKQGILLLNTTLTVREGLSNSHKGKGWELFTGRVLELVNQKDSPVVFIFWGANAKSKRVFITNPHHLILEAPHPSPLARGAFFGCRHFSATNDFLFENRIDCVDWQIV